MKEADNHAPHNGGESQTGGDVLERISSQDQICSVWTPGPEAESKSAGQAAREAQRVAQRELNEQRRGKEGVTPAAQRQARPPLRTAPRVRVQARGAAAGGGGGGCAQGEALGSRDSHPEALRGAHHRAQGLDRN